MFSNLPTDIAPFMAWEWDQVKPYFDDLATRPLNLDTLDKWLSDWTHLSALLSERFARLNVATTVNTTDAKAAESLNHYLDTIYPNLKIANQSLNLKLLESGLQPEHFAIPLRNIQAQIETFNEKNLPLEIKLQKLSQEYDKIIGAQTVMWQGEERTLPQLSPVYQDQDPKLREEAWHLEMNRRLQDRQTLNDLWIQMLQLRQEIAQNAGFKSFRDYQWKRMGRFDYSPENCLSFHKAIKEVIVPAAQRLYEKRCQELDAATLRPWDLIVDTTGAEPLRPFKSSQELEQRCETIFQQVDTELAQYFTAMRQDKLLDLENRKGKAPGGYCTSFDLARQPFIFMNAVGLHDDVQTMLHEAGHAFHVYESRKLPYLQQLDVPMEFAEVASMSMELLAAPYLEEKYGGFYSSADSARARLEHLEGILMFWPYMAVVDGFQHWIYENVEAALNPDNCDEKWGELWQEFMVGIDWQGLEAEMVTGWHRKLHIFQIPFYYIEYGLAQLGAVQVWANSLSDSKGAIQAYRQALKLGGTVTLPELFATAGAKFAFDSAILYQASELLEKTISGLATTN